MKKVFFTTIVLASIFIQLSDATCARADLTGIELEINPPEMFRDAIAGLPFYQAVPFQRGLFWDGEANWHLQIDTLKLPVHAYPVVFWPDGSVRWVAIEGTWPKASGIVGRTQTRLVSAPAIKRDIGTARSEQLCREGNELVLLDVEGSELQIT